MYKLSPSDSEYKYLRPSLITQMAPSMKLIWTWREAYLTNTFHPVGQQGELVVATLLRSIRTNTSL